ncbi:MAG: VRR-NUC domain-containing protein [Lachnospiraceae bacterium]|nr:VRR-NUC domain-containing protein [Lachnospiraceae bacterium]
MGLKDMKRGEDTEQIRVMDWAAGAECRYPELRWLHHIPNGGARRGSEAGRLKRMGVKRGISDIHLPYPHGRYHALYVEMKYGRNVTTQEQREFLCDMMDADNFVAVCHDAQSAIDLIERYVTLPARGLLKVSGGSFDNKNVYWDMDHICHIQTVRGAE